MNYNCKEDKKYFAMGNIPECHKLLKKTAFNKYLFQLW